MSVQLYEIFISLSKLLGLYTYRFIEIIVDMELIFFTLDTKKGDWSLLNEHSGLIDCLVHKD